jgi:O-antigen ligase
MLTLSLERQIFRLVIAVAATVTLIVTPYSVTDPINLPKMVLLVTLAFGIAVILFFNLKRILIPPRKLIFFISGLITINLIIILFVHRIFLSEVFYGTSGRNTGVLTYLSLIFLMLGSLVISSEFIITKILKILFVVGLISMIYGSIQFFGLEPFPFSSPYESKVVGTFGNPNFQSAFMGILIASITPLLLNRRLKTSQKFLTIAFLILGFLSIVQTNSIQGLFSSSIGIGVVLLFHFISLRWKKRAILAGFFLVGGVVLVALSFLNIGPLANIIYKGSMAARVYYWETAFKIIFDNPFFGVGLDQYGDWLRKYRSAGDVATNLTADSAHSVYLDIGVGGGLPLLMFFLLITFLGALSIFRVLKRNIQIPQYYLALVGGWVAFQAQSIISINQIGIAIWGWIFTGLLIGFEVNTRNLNLDLVGRGPKRSNKNTDIIEIHPAILILSVSGLVLGLILALPPFISAKTYFDSLKTGKVIEIKRALNSKPYDRKNFIQASDIFIQNGYEEHSLEVARAGVERFPNSFWLWSRVEELSPKDSALNADAVEKLHLLDPNNPAYVPLGN